jgi:hypothetical protein
MQEGQDHDLLIRIDEKLTNMILSFSNFQKQTSNELKELWIEIESIKLENKSQQGFFSGVKFAWAILGALPPSVILLIFGVNK